MILPREVDSENLVVIAEVQSAHELRSLLDRLTLDEARLVEASVPTKEIEGVQRGPRGPKRSKGVWQK